jgi:hypothetical protein
MMRDSQEVKSPAYHSASRPNEYGVQSKSAKCGAIRSTMCSTVAIRGPIQGEGVQAKGGGHTKRDGI